jgi:hypothetical protein
MSDQIDLSKLVEPFPQDDIEWRVSNAGMGSNGLYCMVVAYITARAIQSRLDDVCGPANWQLTAPIQLQSDRRVALGLGISLKIGEEWVTKWDVSELTDGSDHIPPFKGGFSGAMKRAGSQWGIGRYLYHLDAIFAEVGDSRPQGSRKWNHARLPDKHGGAVFYWKTPSLPAWALPKEPEHEITSDELEGVKQAWRKKFAADTKSPDDLLEGFSRFVVSVAGEFPVSDYTCWTRDALERCQKRIEETTDPGGVSPDVPFDSE